VVRRALEDRYEIIESKLPAMITVVRECNLPRYPTVLGRLEAAEVKPPVWNNDILKLDPNTIGLNGSPTQVRRIFAPQREKGEILDGEGDKKDLAVDAIFGKLRDWDFVTLEK
jgi:electron transfer flavoprotein beta subunit